MFLHSDTLVDDPAVLSAVPTFARYFAHLWLVSAISVRIECAKLRGPEVFATAIRGAITALRDTVERRWLAEREALLERYPWLDAQHVAVAVEGLRDDATMPHVVVTHLDTLP